MTTTPHQGAPPTPTRGPKLGADEHKELDRQLARLQEALRTGSLPPHDRLVSQARAILDAHPALSGNPDGNWQSCQWEERIHLTWGQFGDNRNPVWKAMHAAFLEICTYVFRVQTSRQADVVAGAVGEYLELRGHRPAMSRPATSRRKKPMEDGLTKLQELVLIALYHLHANGAGSRRSSSEIAESISNSHVKLEKECVDAEQVKGHLKALKKLGLVESIDARKRGRAGGYYLSAEGKRRAKKFSSGD